MDEKFKNDMEFTPEPFFDPYRDVIWAKGVKWAQDKILPLGPKLRHDMGQKMVLV